MLYRFSRCLITAALNFVYQECISLYGILKRLMLNIVLCVLLLLGMYMNLTFHRYRSYFLHPRGMTKVVKNQ